MERVRCLNCGYAAPAGEDCPRCAGEAALSGRYTIPNPRADWIRNYSVGFGYFLAGFRFMSLHPRLFKYLIIPLIICVVIFAAMLFGCFQLIDPLLSFLDSAWPAWLDWIRSIFYWLLYALLVLLSLLLCFFLTLILSTVINSPFYDFLSEKVEEIYLGRSFDERWTWEYVMRSILVPIKESAKLALYQTGATILLFIVSVLSAGLGTVLFALAGPYLASLTLFDFVMARKVYSLAEKRKYLHANLPLAMGFGTPAYLLPLLTPFAIVGATLAFLASPYK